MLRRALVPSASLSWHGFSVVSFPRLVSGYLQNENITNINLMIIELRRRLNFTLGLLQKSKKYLFLVINIVDY